MRSGIRAGLTVAAVAVLVTVLAPVSGAAAAAAPQTQPVVVNGSGPDDLLTYAARGFATAAPVVVTLDAVAPGTYHAPLATQVPATPGAVVASSATQRTPADLTPGDYTITFTQPPADEGGEPTVVTTSPFTIVPPSATLPATPRLLPGTATAVQLRGLGAGFSVRRTLTLSGVGTVASTPSEGALGIRQSFTVPTNAAAGTHTLSITQNANPATAVTVPLVVPAPAISLSTTVTSERGSLTVTGRDFGIGDRIVVSVADDGGDRYALTTVDAGPTFRATVRLPGISGGTATVTAQSAHNRATAHAQVDVYGSQLRSPEFLSAGGRLQSPNGSATFQMQADGNLVLYVAGKATWSSRTTGHPGAYLAIQSDGNLVVYAQGRALWSSRTAKQDPPVRLIVQDDGTVVLYSASGRALWSTGTGHPGTLLAGQTLAAGSRLTGPGRVSLVV